MEKRFVHITFLLLAGQLIGEIWHLFDSPGIHLVNWFYDPPKFLPDITYAVKDISDSITKIIWFIAFYKLAQMINSRLAGVIVCFIFYFLCELVLFFVCYKVYGYQYVYACTGIFIFLTLYRKK